MSIQALKGVWWKKVDRSEKLWLSIALAWCLVLFAMMPLWHWKGGQNPSFETYRITAADYQAKVEAYVQKTKVGEDRGFPVVAPARRQRRLPDRAPVAVVADARARERPDLPPAPVVDRLATASRCSRRTSTSRCSRATSTC